VRGWGWGRNVGRWSVFSFIFKMYMYVAFSLPLVAVGNACVWDGW